jgi:heptosyltransferase-3
MSKPSVLVIRRENIGDLICTTPLVRALRAQKPGARIVALVSGYSAAVLDNNPDLNAVYAYTKAKHRDDHESLFGIYARRLRLIRELRRENFDWILLPGGSHASALRFARWIGGERLLVRGPEDAAAGPHEVEQCCHLLTRMGLRYEAPPARLQPDAGETARLAAVLAAKWRKRPSRLVALHISARKPSQRWPAVNFAKLARALCQDEDVGLILLWAPGGAEQRGHPGDDDKARSVLADAGVPIVAIPTARLEELIAALALCDSVVCGDGGAMHIAAALGKPVVCLFGQSDAAHWGPWGVQYELLQKPSREVRDIEAPEVHAAWLRLHARLALATVP